MQHFRQWSDGTKIKGKRLIQAFDCGVLVERKPTPGGISRWIARCEHDGCKQTYDFTDTKSRRTKESRCSLHVSRSNVNGGRVFFGDIEVIGERMRQAFFEGRVLSAEREPPRGVRWTVRCSAYKCLSTLRLGSTQKSSSRFQLCAECNLKRMKTEAAECPDVTGQKNNRYVWTDGSWIIGRRIQQAFLDGKLVAKEGTRWRAKCEEPGCAESYDFTAIQQAQAQQERCTLHTLKMAAGVLRKKKIYINGHWTTNTDLAHFASRLVWIKGGKSVGHVPWLKCAEPNCKEMLRYTRGGKNVSCQKHCGEKRRLRPYEAIYNLFVGMQKSRNKKRKSPLQVQMSYQEFARFCDTNPDCFFCGKTIGRLPHVPKDALIGGRGTNVRAAYLDRVDPTGHYTLGNVVSACGPCNMSKNIFVSHNEMILLGKLRSGRFNDAVKQIHNQSGDFEAWGKEVANHSSYWAGGRGGKRKNGDTI